MEKIRILIADDTEIIAKQTEKALDKLEEVEVIGIAKDGQEEIDLINELKPDLVFSDNQMPKMNGIEVIEKVYNSNMENKPQFIFATGDRDMLLMKRANECEVVRIIHKPFFEEDIISAFEEYKELKEMGAFEKKDKTEVVERKTEEKKEEVKVSLFQKIKDFLNS